MAILPMVLGSPMRKSLCIDLSGIFVHLARERHAGKVGGRAGNDLSRCLKWSGGLYVLCNLVCCLVLLLCIWQKGGMLRKVRLRAGNDLARCLNWGGGLYVLRDRGLPAMLHDVEHATVSLLDRWDVKIARAQPELSAAAQQIQRMSSLVARDKPETEQVLGRPARGRSLSVRASCA